MMMVISRKAGEMRVTVVKGEVEGESVVMEHSLQSEAGDGETIENLVKTTWSATAR